MKVILSRKGMDSEAGGMASPILPDGTLLSLPIPDENSNQQYGELYYKGHSFREIIHQLNPRFNFARNVTCHLDPDIYDGIEGKTKGWKAAFGQSGVSASHLDKMEVDEGDVFLFYGMFKGTVWRSDGRLSYVPGAPIRHIIYGYMEVGKILKNESDIQEYAWHPHSINMERPDNRLYLPKKYGTFQYDNSLVLTKPEQNSRRMWRLPAFFAQDGISISWQGKNRPVFIDGYAELNSSCRGQEFVITTDTPEQQDNIRSWVDDMIQRGIQISNKPKKEVVNHFNYLDENGNIFCKRQDKVLTIASNYNNCNDCPYLFGSLQGQGVECKWEDIPAPSPCGRYVYDPQEELVRISKLIEDKIIKKG